MFGVIVEKELREILQSPRFSATYGVVAVLILLSFWLGGWHYLQGLSEFEAARSEARRQLEGRTDWSGVEALAQRPPQALESLVNGVGYDVGRLADVDPGVPVRARSSLYGERPLLALWRFLDLEFVFRVVVSLFAILFAFDAISGEKERGTLRLVLSHAVPRDVFVLAKLTGAFLGLAVPLLLPILGGCLILVVQGVPMAVDEWLRLALVVGAGFLHLLAFLSLSLFVSARTRRSASSFLLLLVVWIGVVLVLPRASVLAAGRWVEVPSADQELSQRSRLATQLFREDREAIDAFLQASSGPDGSMRFDFDIEEGEDPAAAVAEFQARINTFLQDRAETRRERLDALESRLAEERRNREAQRRRIALGLARLSPAATFSLAAFSLAGTSLDLPDRFVEQATRYRDAFGRFLREKTGGAGGSFRIVVRAEGEDEREPEPIDPGEMPVFTFEPPRSAEALRDAAPSLALLLAFTGLFFVGAHVSFLRYDPR